MVMCAHCEDLALTAEMIEDLACYAMAPGADQPFADVVGFALGTALQLAMSTPAYPPPGHTYPAPEQ